MNAKVAGLIVSLMLFGFVPQSLANVSVLSFTVTPDPITSGDSALVDLQLQLTADPGFSNANFLGGFVTLFSGDGASQIFSIGNGGSFREFQATFSYPYAGDYHPGFLSVLGYTEHFGRFATIATGQILFDKISLTVTDPEISVSAAAPELSTWAMMLIGFAGIAFAAYRRKKKGVAPIGSQLVISNPS